MDHSHIQIKGFNKLHQLVDLSRWWWEWLFCCFGWINKRALGCGLPVACPRSIHLWEDFVSCDFLTWFSETSRRIWNSRVFFGMVMLNFCCPCWIYKHSLYSLYVIVDITLYWVLGKGDWCRYPMILNMRTFLLKLYFLNQMLLVYKMSKNLYIY